MFRSKITLHGFSITSPPRLRNKTPNEFKRLAIQGGMERRGVLPKKVPPFLFPGETIRE
jgi:hypothetical protein